MLYKYPYTNLYNLNLDWIIKAIKEMQEIVAPLDSVVNSVNEMTGDVEITKALLTQILGNLVETFNGRSGEVELTADDVNATMIDITWTSDPGDTIADLTQTELDEMYTSGKRILIFVNNLGVADKVYFLQYYSDHAQPQEYTPTSALAGVASFNGQTGNVTATGADLATSGTDSTTIAASLANLENTKVPNTRTVNNQPLSANVSIDAANVPSQAIAGATDVEMALGNLYNSKVSNARQVNGKSLLNDITLNDEDIPSDVDGQTNVADVLNYQSQQIANVQNGLAYIVGNTNTTGSILENGTFVYVKGHSTIAEGLRKVTNPISAGADITINNTEACPNGGLNVLNSNFALQVFNGSVNPSINIPNGQSGLIGSANIPAGVWIVNISGWCPSINGYITCDGHGTGWGRDGGGSTYMYNLTFVHERNSAGSLEVSFTNYAADAVTSAPGFSMNAYKLPYK